MDRAHYLMLSLALSLIQFGICVYGLIRLFNEYPAVTPGVWAIIAAVAITDWAARRYERLAA